MTNLVDQAASAAGNMAGSSGNHLSWDGQITLYVFGIAGILSVLNYFWETLIVPKIKPLVGYDSSFGKYIHRDESLVIDQIARAIETPLASALASQSKDDVKRQEDVIGLLKKVLHDVGINQNVIDNARKAIIRRAGNTDRPFQRLVVFLKRSLYRWSGNGMAQYGKSTPVSTRYYVNTMSSTHSEELANEMCDLLLQLRALEQPGTPMPDFVLTPKAGNPLLGHRFAETCSLVCLIHKSAKESSHVALSKEQYADKFIVHVEGSVELQDEINHLEPGRSMRGIVVDCNASGGKQILQAMDEFNELTKALNMQIEPVVDAYILFCVDDEKGEGGRQIDEKFSSKGYKVHRYFDLNETSKALLDELPITSLAEPASQAAIKQFLREMKTNGRIKARGVDDELK